MTKLTAADGHTFDLYEVRPDDAAAAIVREIEDAL